MAYNFDKKFMDEIMKAHNHYREMHDVNPLKHSAMLDRSAQEWANKLLKADTMTNSQLAVDGKVGENISVKTTKEQNYSITGTDVTKLWYADVKNYDFKTGEGSAGNFTQLVWRATKEVGFGKAQKPGKCVVVAHYKPPGNVMDKYVRNVMPVKEGAKKLGPPKPSAPVRGASPSRAGAQAKGAPTKSPQLTVTRDTMEYEGASSGDQGKLVTHEVDGKSLTTAQAAQPPQPADAASDDKTNKPEVRLTKTQIFVNAMIEGHNGLRKKHGVEPLKENKMLNQMAQTWADILLTKQQLEHSEYSYENQELGENLAARVSSQPCDYKPDEVVSMWYEEEKNHHYDREPEDIQEVGNFTQMVWKETREIGVGHASDSESADKRAIVVCLYHPAGNFVDGFKNNVLSPKK